MALGKTTCPVGSTRMFLKLCFKIMLSIVVLFVLFVYVCLLVLFSYVLACGFLLFLVAWCCFVLLVL